jgi:hypothetical protein
MQRTLAIFAATIVAATPCGLAAQGAKYGSGACPNRSEGWSHIGPIPINGYPFNVLGIDEKSRKTWNGTPITDDEMMQLLRVLGGSYSGAMVIFQPRPDTGCEEVIRIRRIMDDFLNCFEYCKEGDKFRNFDFRGFADH